MAAKATDSPRHAIRVLIVHPNRLFRDALACGLAKQSDMIVVGAVREAGEILREIEKLNPDVIIVGLCLPAREGFREARRVRELSPAVKILRLDTTDLESNVLSCIGAGAAGYLSQESSLEDLLEYIHRLVAGEALSSPRIAGLLFARVADGAEAREELGQFGAARLTRREIEIISLIKDGQSNKEIAGRLGIATQTVKNHVHNILEKLDLSGRWGVARYVREVGSRKI